MISTLVVTGLHNEEAIFGANLADYVKTNLAFYQYQE